MDDARGDEAAESSGWMFANLPRGRHERGQARAGAGQGVGIGGLHPNPLPKPQYGLRATNNEASLAGSPANEIRVWAKMTWQTRRDSFQFQVGLCGQSDAGRMVAAPER
jgi:hypothetical protein